MLTDKRDALRPSEYPEFLPYKDAVRHAYWLHTEYNLTEDVHDFRTRTLPHERQALQRALLAIAQLELKVKTFWADVYRHFPKPEVAAVGYTFAESEVRHQDAYAHLLDVLGLDEAFAQLGRFAPLRERLALMERHLKSGKTTRDYPYTVMLFSAFVEHVSLFGQFLLIKAFNRERGLFKGVANIVEATSKEEQIHGLFGYALINTLRREVPERFGDFEARLTQACYEFYGAEAHLVDWILEGGELAFLDKGTMLNYLRHRCNEALRAVQLRPPFDTDAALLERVQWFDEELLSGKHVDFFHKRPVTYSKKQRSITADDLFT